MDPGLASRSFTSEARLFTSRSPVKLDWFTSRSPVQRLDWFTSRSPVQLHWFTSRSPVQLYWFTSRSPVQLYWFSSRSPVQLDWFLKCVTSGCTNGGFGKSGGGQRTNLSEKVGVAQARLNNHLHSNSNVCFLEPSISIK
jgi:hypothetical protein